MEQTIYPGLGQVYMQKLAKARDRRARDLQRLRQLGRFMIFVSVLSMAVVAGFLVAMLPVLL